MQQSLYFKYKYGKLRWYSEVFFLEEGRDGYYEVKFGDNIIGKRPGNGNTVKIEYSTISIRC